MFFKQFGWIDFTSNSKLILEVGGARGETDLNREKLKNKSDKISMIGL